MRRIDHEAIWYGRRRAPAHWRALSWVFGKSVALRVWLYRRGWLKSDRPACPIIVVGNITAGGTGKTPLVLWVTETLQSAGYRPGIVSRGYRGSHRKGVLEVHSDTDPTVAGDEPVLLARHSGFPVAVARRRARAARYLAEEAGVNVIVADDGLQHYALGRDVEICVLDGERRFGNARFLPAGPLREPVDRLRRVDFVVANGEALPGEVRMTSTLADPRPVEGGDQRPLSAFRGSPVHAVAGIGHPEKFFTALEAAGLELTHHPFPDHHAYEARDLAFDDAPVLMTEKDAVKCLGLDLENAWFVPVAVQLPVSFRRELLERIEALQPPPA